jgi:hypothetical protein
MFFLVNLPTSRAILFSIFHKPQVGVVYYWLYHVKFWRLYRGVTLRYGQNLWSKLGEPSHQYVYVYIYIYLLVSSFYLDKLGLHTHQEWWIKQPIGDIMGI